MEQLNGSKLGNDYIKAENTSCKIPGWMNHKLESNLQGEILTTSDMQRTPL